MRKYLRRGSSSWFAAMALSVVTGCSSESPAPEQSEPPGSVRGKLALQVATFDDGHREVQRLLRVGGNEHDERPLDFGEPVDLRAGTEIRVWGDYDGQVFHVDRYEIVR